MATLSELCEAVTIDAEYIGPRHRTYEGMKTGEQFDWTCTLTYQGRKMTVPFHMGAAHVEWRGSRQFPKAPSAYDVVYCLLSDASYTVTCSDEFDLADELGEAVTRESRETWRQMVKQTNDLRALLGTEFETWLYVDMD